MAERTNTNEKLLNITTNVTVKISNSKKNYFDNLAKQLCSKTDSENSVRLVGVKKDNKLNFEKHFKALAMSESWPTIKCPVAQT